MNMIVGQFRYVLYHGHVFRPAHVVLMLLACSAAFLVSLAVFRRAARNLPKEI
jgi:ABC-type polysaccharide/polyol phosphate export permease